MKKDKNKNPTLDLLNPLDPSMGFSPKNFNYISGQPYIEIIAIYKSDIDLLLGKPPIRIKSVKHIDPHYTIIDDKIKSCSIIPFKK